MDAMALLCNLHADGPSTLRSLREGGCASLEDLVNLSPEALAELLGFAPAAARRFLREGRNLRERLGGELLEREEELQVPVAVAQAAHAPPAELRVRDRELLARVLQRWKAEEGASAEDPPAVAARPSSAPAKGSVASPAEPGMLEPGSVDGLDARTCKLLATLGVRSLEDLARCAPEEAQARLGLSYSRVRRLQFLARRKVDPSHCAARPELSARAEERISLAFPAFQVPHAPLEAPLATEPALPRESEARGGPFA